MNLSHWVKQAFAPKPEFKEKDWIDVSLSMLWDVSNAKKDIESHILEVGQDIGTIFLNTQLVFNTNNEYMGTINPYLGVNTFLTYAPHTKNQVLKSLSATYVVQITKKIDGDWYHISENKKKKVESWRIELKPYKGKTPKKFKLSEFNYELLGLTPISEWLCKRYDLNTRDASFTPIFISKKPAIEKLDNPMLFKNTYLVEDRLKYGEINNPKLDEYCLGGSILEDINAVRNNKLYNKTKTSNKPETAQWLSEADKLVKKYNL